MTYSVYRAHEDTTLRAIRYVPKTVGDDWIERGLYEPIGNRKLVEIPTDERLKRMSSRPVVFQRKAYLAIDEKLGLLELSGVKFDGPVMPIEGHQLSL